MTAIEETKERWFEAEIYRMAGEIELKFPNVDGANQKRISNVLSRLRVSSKQNLGSCAPQ